MYSEKEKICLSLSLFSKLLYHHWLQNKATIACIHGIWYTHSMLKCMYHTHICIYTHVYVHISNNLPYIQQYLGKSPLFHYTGVTTRYHTEDQKCVLGSLCLRN